MSQGGGALNNRPDSSEERGSAGDVLHHAIRSGSSFSGRERHCGFLNLRNGRFADISPVSGLDFPDDGRAVARVDWDQDGDLDFWLVNRSGPQVRFMRNGVPQENNFLAVRLQGRTCNRDAIGARVEVYVQGAVTPQIQTLAAGDGFLSQSSKALHFGLGQAKAIDRLVVRWPGGDAQTLTGLEINGHYDVVQGSGQASRRAPRAAITLKSSVLEQPRTGDQAQIISSAKLPLPLLSYKTFDGQSRLVNRSDKSGQAKGTLLNLWAGWCAPCRVELKEWSQRADELQAAGLRVVALSVDGLDGDQAGGIKRSKDALKQSGVPFEAGMASPRTVELLQMVHDHLFDMHRPLPVPTSVLIDPAGRVAAFYKGKVGVDRLLSDLKQIKSGTVAQASALDGKWLEAEQQASSFRLVWQMLEAGYLNETLEYISRNDPRLTGHFEYHKLLTLAGNHLSARRQDQDAVAYYQTALKVAPGYVEAQNNLAWVMATSPDEQARNGNEAIRLAESVAKQAGLIPSYMDTLAAAYAETGRFPEAITQVKRAIEIATSQGDTKMVKDLNIRLQAYESGKPWREK